MIKSAWMKLIFDLGACDWQKHADYQPDELLWIKLVDYIKIPLDGPQCVSHAHSLVCVCVCRFQHFCPVLLLSRAEMDVFHVTVCKSCSLGPTMFLGPFQRWRNILLCATRLHSVFLLMSVSLLSKADTSAGFMCAPPALNHHLSNS